jgi:hypothetical protein
MREVFKWKKGEQITSDCFTNVESAIRCLTEPRDEKGNLLSDPEDNDRDVQYAKVNIEIVVKTWRQSRCQKSHDHNR